MCAFFKLFKIYNTLTKRTRQYVYIAFLLQLSFDFFMISPYNKKTTTTTQQHLNKKLNSLIVWS